MTLNLSLARSNTECFIRGGGGTGGVGTGEGADTSLARLI